MDKVKKRSILLVEDNDDILRIVADVLSLEFNVIEASDGSEAIDILLKIDPSTIDLIVSDGHMPNVCGLQLLEKTIPLGLKTLIITGDFDSDQYLKGGACEVLSKPFDCTVLFDIINRNLTS